MLVADVGACRDQLLAQHVRCFTLLLFSFHSFTLFLSYSQALADANALPCCLVLPAANYYDVLGVDVDASEEDIRAAYRKRAKQLHPDVNKEVSNSTAAAWLLSA